MHNLDAPNDLEKWYTRRVIKYKRQLTEYQNCGVRLPHEDIINSFIHEKLTLMINRPNLFQHDDFHPVNLLVENGHYAGAIDFNRYWGDPIHDFLKIAYFSREVSIPFSIDQIEGYFDGIIPEFVYPKIVGIH